MPIRPRVFLSLCLALLGAACLPAALRAQNAPVILSVSYNSTYATQYIGTTLSVQMTAVQPLANVAVPFAVSVTASGAGPAGFVTLGGLFSGVATAGDEIFVSDGQRVWMVTYSGGNTITINPADLLPTAEGHPATDIPASWPVPDYSQLINTTFAVYDGTLVTNATATAQMTVDIGQFAQVVLYDNGSNGDQVAGDGIWTAQYQVPNLNSVVTDANFYGECLVADVPAVNEGFQSGQNVSFDMEFPSIKTYSQSTTNVNYNGDLYLSSQCEQQNVANAVATEPLAAASCAQAQFNFTVNKANTTVVITIGGTAAQPNPDFTSGAYPAYPMVPVTLPSYVFPNAAPTLNGWCIWNGADGNGNYVKDGIYTVYYYIYDTSGLSGVTVTSRIKVVSLEMSISGITLSPSNIGTSSNLTDGVITSVGYTVSLYNDSASSADMNSSLGVLGWGDAGQTSSTFPQDTDQNLTTTVISGINSAGDAESTVWSYLTSGYLSPAGAFTQFGQTTDISDDDANIAGALYPYFAAFSDVNQTLAENLATVTCSGDVASIPMGSYVVTGDGNPANDWRPKGFTWLAGVSSGTNLNPVVISQKVTTNWVGSVPPQGSYRMDLQSVLTGLAITGNVAQAPDVVDSCSPTAGAVFSGDHYHFWPQYQLDTLNQNLEWGGPIQGDELACQNTTAVFNVNATANPTGDNTPPQFVVSAPAANSILQPGVYNYNAPLSVEFQDTAANFNTGSSYSYIALSGPNGAVQGVPSTNGGGLNGTLTLYFQPDNPLAAGGNYTMTAYTCNVDGLCVQQSIPFTVVDTTAPAIVANNGVVLSSETSAQPISIPLCESTPAGPYQFVDQVAVTVAIPSTSKNTIYLPGCSVSLYQVSGTAQIPVGMTQLPSENVTSTEATLVYQISPPLPAPAVYEVVTQTESQDPSQTLHIGPAAQAADSDCSNDPEFTTESCVGCLILQYSNNPSTTCLAASSLLPNVSVVNKSGTSVPLTSISALKPSTATLPKAQGYTFLQTATGGNSSTSDPALEFYVNGTLETTPLTWTFAAAGNLEFSLWFNQSDLTAASTAATNLVVLGYNGSSWNTVSDAYIPPSPTAATAIQCTIPVPNAAAAYDYYALAFPAGSGSGTAVTTTAVATPVSFPSTRAFDPDSATSPDARFYYSTVAPQSMNVEVYDTAGRRVRSLSLGDGISATDYTTDPVYNSNVMYYFQWDGKNDGGQVVRNGIYLVRWNEQGVDGSNHAQVKPVALIK